MPGTRRTAVENLEVSDVLNEARIGFENTIEPCTQDIWGDAGLGKGGKGDGGEEVLARGVQPGLAYEGAGGEGSAVCVEVVDDGVDELLGQTRRAHGARRRG